MGKLRLGQNASAGRTRHSADASDPPCLLHPGAGVRGARAGVTKHRTARTAHTARTALKCGIYGMRSGAWRTRGRATPYTHGKD